MTPNRPASQGYTARNSVFHTQKLLSQASSELHETREKAKELEARVQRLTEQHRAQIDRSLTSPEPEEQRAAASIAAFWEVPVPEPVPTDENA